MTVRPREVKKQDRSKPREPADLERKYRLGDIWTAINLIVDKLREGGIEITLPSSKNNKGRNE
jgi:hypothetical protein